MLRIGPVNWEATPALTLYDYSCILYYSTVNGWGGDDKTTERRGEWRVAEAHEEEKGTR